MTTTPTHNVQTLDDPNPYSESEDSEQEQENEETPTFRNQLQDGPSSSEFATHPDEGEEMIITSIRATDVALGLRRIPAGFHTVVQHSGHEWRSENKCSSVNNDVVEWDGPIPVPSDPSATIHFRVYASFEFQPMLGNGEQLQKLTITVERLLKRSAEDRAFTFFPKDGDVVSPCSSLLVTVGRRKDESSDPSTSRMLSPSCSITESRSQLENATNEGHSALTRYRKHGERRDLEHSVEHYQLALNICPYDHPCRAAVQSNMAMAKLIHYRVDDTDDSLDVSLGLYRDALSARPVGHLDRPSTLTQLAAVHFAQFEKGWDGDDKAQAEVLLYEAIDLTPSETHEQRAAILMVQLLTRHEVDPVQECGESSVEQEFTSGLTTEDPWDLSVELLIRFHSFGYLEDIQRAISLLEGCIRSASLLDPWYTIGLTNLGAALLYRFKRLGELDDLEEAISRLGDAVRLTPDGDPDKHDCLNNLGISFIARFERLGDLRDMEEAISMLGDAVRLTPDGHPDKPARLNNLGNSFIARFERFGELRDLEQAISMQGDAVRLTPDDHLHKPAYLNNLGNSFRARFERLGVLHDLEEAISAQGDAVRLTPDSHPDKLTSLNNLGKSFRARFERLGELRDLEQAISTLGDAVHLTPDDHPHKPAGLNSLGKSFRARFKRLGELRDLEEAISTLRDAVRLTPDSHPDKPDHLNNLGNSFITRFERFGELHDLEEAISTLGDAFRLTPDGHPDKPARLNNLGHSSRARFERLGELRDLQQAISLYSHAACAPTGPIFFRFSASQSWISCARLSEHYPLLHAFSFAIRLLPQLAWTGLSLTDRYRELMQGADVVREAAAAALDSRLPELAVEWLEQGRSIVWGEFFQLRSSYDDLSAVHPDHARRLRELSTALERAGIAREKSLSSPSEAIEALDEEAGRHRTLAIERDSLLQEIRRLPGFERFLLDKAFAQLRTSAHTGPVVILNAAKTRCDALIVLDGMDNVIHVPLPNFTLARSESLQTSMKNLIREGKSMPEKNPVQWEPILSALWKCVVKPVLDSLVISTPEDLSHIFWCPTGPLTFLPIHAAGLYDTKYSQPGHKVFDFVVSSYVPTLSILAPSPKPDATSSDDLRFLAVRQPHSDGLTRLPGVHAELAHIKAVIQNSPSARTTLVESSLGTVEEVLDLMKQADWVHFACHGVQEGVDSGLCLANKRRLKIADIITLSRPRGGLAFLSACQTATGDKELSDEAIHITAGMLFAGYGGVVGTMWSISDKLAPRVAKGVYERLFRKGTKPDYREAARALQDTIGCLRDGGASFGEWLPFIHVGL